MASEVEICNMALSHLRAGSINSLTEASLQAQQCKLWYPILRDQLLEDAPWGFAHGLKAMAVLASVSIFNWSYAYQYPSDCLKINRLVLNWESVSTDSAIYAQRLAEFGLALPDLKRQVEYEIHNVDGNRVIAANESELRIDYVKNITDPNIMSTQFRVALSYLLGAAIAAPIVGVEKGLPLQDKCLGMYAKYISAASSKDLNERYSEDADSEFITIRG